MRFRCLTSAIFLLGLVATSSCTQQREQNGSNPTELTPSTVLGSGDLPAVPDSQPALPQIHTALATIEQSPTYKIETDELTELQQDGLISDAELAQLKASLNL